MNNATDARTSPLSLAACGVIIAVAFAAFAVPPPAVNLPAPRHTSDVSLEAALAQRRSVRSYASGQVTLEELSQLLWAAQGITDASGFRTAPSAGALYPLEVYVVAGDVKDLPDGVYHYLPREHRLHPVMDGDRRIALADAALGQSSIRTAAVDIVIAGVYERTSVKYGTRAVQYVHIEVGCAAQNVYLEATALGLGTVYIGAFSDDNVRRVLHMPSEERPFAIMPVGRK